MLTTRVIRQLHSTLTKSNGDSAYWTLTGAFSKQTTDFLVDRRLSLRLRRLLRTVSGAVGVTSPSNDVTFVSSRNAASSSNAALPPSKIRKKHAVDCRLRGNDILKDPFFNKVFNFKIGFFFQ